MAPKDRRVLVLCDERAPYPVMVGQWDGEQEQFVSRDKGCSGGKKWSVLGWLPLPEPGPILVFPPTCSFCGKDSDQVNRLVAGPAVMICDECIALCDEIIAKDAAASGTLTEGGDVEQAPGESLSGPAPIGETPRG